MRQLCQSALGFTVLATMALSSHAAQTPTQGFQTVRDAAARPLVLAGEGGPAADILLLHDSELIRNAAEWLAGAVRRSAGAARGAGGAEAAPAIGGAERLKGPGPHVAAAVGLEHPLVKRLAGEGKFQADPAVGEQGFILQRIPGGAAGDAAAGEILLCWSPAPLGCRYGLIEIIRRLAVSGRSVRIEVARVVDRPRFPVRICYVNFAEHLQNAYNPNVLFDTPRNRWSPQQWERFIDMLSAFRYNVFEFWLVPTLFSPEALSGGRVQADFARTMAHVIPYARRRGVSVHPIQAVNTVGGGWHYHCPKDPKEHAEIVALWDHWAKALAGIDSIGFFPGDPGGCTRNGCTAQTFVDLCLELAPVVRKHNPTLKVEVGTWGDPFAGWGVGLWTGKPQRAREAMGYFLGKLGQFPPGTFTSINLGFSPDCTASHGGDARAYAKQAAATRTVLTWDYSVTEGESTVSPRCRVRRIFDRRREEADLGCYSGGICYTMAPRLNCASLFCCSEAYWDPTGGPDQALARFGRLVFGEDLAAAGALLEEFEVIPDWGHYPPFPYTPDRLRKAMARLQELLRKVDPAAESRLPLLPTLAEHRQDLLYFAELFEKLASTALAMDEARKLAAESGRLPKDLQNALSLDVIEQVLLAGPGDFPQKARLAELAERLRQLDVRGLTRGYWERVYGIYDSIPHPVDPRAQGAASGLFRRFNCQLAVAHKPSAFEKAVRAAGKPVAMVDFGSALGQRGWTLGGWTVRGEDDGLAWRASFDQPGLISREDFKDRDYRWLAVHLTEGPKGGAKTIALNGQVIGRFVRTGPPREVKKEWWVTRSFAIPPGLLGDGHVEIRFSEPGIAVHAVALTAERIPDAEE